MFIVWLHKSSAHLPWPVPVQGNGYCPKPGSYNAAHAGVKYCRLYANFQTGNCKLVHLCFNNMPFNVSKLKHFQVALLLSWQGSLNCNLQHIIYQHIIDYHHQYYHYLFIYFSNILMVKVTQHLLSSGCFVLLCGRFVKY